MAWSMACSAHTSEFSSMYASSCERISGNFVSIMLSTTPISCFGSKTLLIFTKPNVKYAKMNSNKSVITTAVVVAERFTRFRSAVNVSWTSPRRLLTGPILGCSG